MSDDHRANIRVKLILQFALKTFQRKMNTQILKTISQATGSLEWSGLNVLVERSADYRMYIGSGSGLNVLVERSADYRMYISMIGVGQNIVPLMFYD